MSEERTRQLPHCGQCGTKSQMIESFAVLQTDTHKHIFFVLPYMFAPNVSIQMRIDGLKRGISYETSEYDMDCTCVSTTLVADNTITTHVRTPILYCIIPLSDIETDYTKYLSMIIMLTQPLVCLDIFEAEDIIIMNISEHKLFYHENDDLCKTSKITKVARQVMLCTENIIEPCDVYFSYNYVNGMSKAYKMHEWAHATHEWLMEYDK